ncbi:DUF7344 domain-containing protein [Salinadaptatus halalkaliphilus]|uniref:DUF7344 domain-containing protein n=1 Tax=Salinadaptatus halalkaliphilus TaxID=2419781 RepID=UPI00157FD07D|nr:hypothetical protein [Salinadaptatus halalkaliphilus]
MSNELDDLLEVLKSERRRIVLNVLSEVQREESNDEVTVHARDLARQVAAIEAGVESTAVGQTTRRKAAIGLYHTHLPVLAEHGIVDYDQQSKTVSTTDRTPVVAQVMQSIEETIETANSDMSGPPDMVR